MTNPWACTLTPHRQTNYHFAHFAYIYRQLRLRYWEPEKAYITREYYGCYHWILIIINITSPAVIKLSLNFLFLWQISKFHRVNDGLPIIWSLEPGLICSTVVAEIKYWMKKDEVESYFFSKPHQEELKQ